MFLRSKYVYDRKNLAAVFGSENTVEKAFIFGPHIDEPLGMIYTEGRLYYHANHQGSIMAVTDASGARAAAYSYSPFGRTISDNDSMTNAFRYTGREYDAEDLYYYRARYYEPTVQRFLSEDPIGYLGGSLNLYGYCLNDPVNWIDPLGLLSYEQNRQRRKSLNTGLMTKGVKTVAGFVVSSQIVKNLGKAGLGVTAGTIIKNRGAVPALGITGTVANLAATAIVKGGLVSASFYAGIEAGSNIGANFDTLVDDGSEFLGLSPEIFESMGFGSGIPNSDPCEK